MSGSILSARIWGGKAKTDISWYLMQVHSGASLVGVFGKRREWDRSQGSADMLPLGDGAEAGGGRWPELKTRVTGWRHFDLAMESGISLQVFSL